MQRSLAAPSRGRLVILDGLPIGNNARAHFCGCAGRTTLVEAGYVMENGRQLFSDIEVLAVSERR